MNYHWFCCVNYFWRKNLFQRIRLFLFTTGLILAFTITYFIEKVEKKDTFECFLFGFGIFGIFANGIRESYDKHEFFENIRSSILKNIFIFFGYRISNWEHHYVMKHMYIYENIEKYVDSCTLKLNTTFCHDGPNVNWIKMLYFNNEYRPSYDIYQIFYSPDNDIIAKITPGKLNLYEDINNSKDIFIIQPLTQETEDNIELQNKADRFDDNDTKTNMIKIFMTQFLIYLIEYKWFFPTFLEFLIKQQHNQYINDIKLKVMCDVRFKQFKKYVLNNAPQSLQMQSIHVDEIQKYNTFFTNKIKCPNTFFTSLLKDNGCDTVKFQMEAIVLFMK